VKKIEELKGSKERFRAEVELPTRADRDEGHHETKGAV